MKLRIRGSEAPPEAIVEVWLQQGDGYGDGSKDIVKQSK